jgi:putative redox protein
MLGPRGERFIVQEVKLAEASLVWIQEEQFVGIDSSKHAVVLSSQNGVNSVGMKPSELLLVSLAGCTAVDVVRILEKQRMPISSLAIRVTGEQQPDPPWTYETIHMHFLLRGKRLTEPAVTRAIELSEAKYCSVSATLRAQVKITWSFELIRDES